MVWLGTMDTLPSGIVHVSNPEHGLWGDRSPWQLVEVAKIGTRLDSGPEVFGNVWDIDVDESGRVYVFDWQAWDVRLFERDGRYVRTIGRRGGGPGEFRRVNGIAVDSANRLWVNNQGNLRYSVFDSSGLLVSEPRKGGSSVEFVTWRSIFGTDGDLYEEIGYRTPSGLGFGLARFDPITQQHIDTLPQCRFPEDTKFPTGISALVADGWWCGVSLTYRLSQLNFTGDTVRIVERAHEADLFSAAERDSAKRQERDLNRRVRQGEIDLETILRPIFQTVLVDDLDHLWVMLAPQPEDQNTRFDIFDPIGRYLGKAAAAHVIERTPAPVFRDGRIYYVTKDELDVQYVVVAEIRGRK